MDTMMIQLLIGGVLVFVVGYTACYIIETPSRRNFEIMGDMKTRAESAEFALMEQTARTLEWGPLEDYLDGLNTWGAFSVPVYRELKRRQADPETFTDWRKNR